MVSLTLHQCGRGFKVQIKECLVAFVHRDNQQNHRLLGYKSEDFTRSYTLSFHMYKKKEPVSKSTQDCRNRSGNLINRKISLFYMEAIPNFFSQLQKIFFLERKKYFFKKNEKYCLVFFFNLQKIFFRNWKKLEQSFDVEK